MRKSSIKKNAIVVMLLTLLSSILGFGRESYIAYAFGSTKFTDAYYVAFVVPDIIAGWIGYALTNALIPVLKSEYSTSERLGKQIINNTFYIVIVGSIILSVLSYFFGGHIISLLAPTFDENQHEVGVKLLRIMVIAIGFSALSGFFGGINNSFESYSFPALVGIFFNLFFFVTLVVLKQFLGFEALAYGFISGVIGRFIIQLIPLIVRRQLPIKLNRKWHPKVPGILFAMIPIFLSQGVSQINQIVDRILASGLPEGQVSNLNYASKLGLLPIGLIGSSIAVTAYTRFVKHHNEQNFTQLISLLNRAITWIVLAGFIIGGGIVFFSKSLVSIFYFHGAFTLNDLNTTSKILVIYGIFSFFYMMLPLVSQYYFAQKAGRFLLISSSIAVTFNVVCGYVLVHRYGAQGLVVANGSAQIINVSILYFMAIKRLNSSVLSNLKQISFAVIPYGIITICSFGIVSFVWDMPLVYDKLQLFARGSVAIVVSGLFIIGYTMINRSGELSEVIRNSIKYPSRITKQIREKA